MGKTNSQSIAVDKIGSSYYALPVLEPKQQRQLSALLPPAGADDVPPSTDDCDADPTVDHQVRFLFGCPALNSCVQTCVLTELKVSLESAALMELVHLLPCCAKIIVGMQSLP